MCLLPKFKTGKNAPFVASLSALRVANLQLLSFSSATAISNSPMENKQKQNIQTYKSISVKALAANNNKDSTCQQIMFRAKRMNSKQMQNHIRISQ
jgi:hypothetical protein